MRIARRRTLFGLVAALAAAGPTPAADPPAPPAATPARREPPGVRGTRAQIFDAWLAGDAAVAATYRGVDSTLGPHYHVLDVDAVWTGTPTRGRLVFKAPRGVRGAPGSRGLYFLWDRLGGASDSFLEEAKARYGDDVWRRIGPDSLAAYLLPFTAWSYPFEGDKLVLRGTGAFPVEIEPQALAEDLLEYETSLSPQNLYKTVDVVMRARVRRMQLGTRTEHGAVIERRVLAGFERLEALKGAAPDTLALQFVSVPRSPRFKQGDEVVLFLVRGPQGLYLQHGKRAVYHVVGGEVLEAGRPLGEFVKQLRGA